MDQTYRRNEQEDTLSQRSFISESTALQIYQALILPHFDYCSSAWHELNVTSNDKLQTLQNIGPPGLLPGPVMTQVPVSS